MSNYSLDSVPIWAVYVGLFLLFLLSVEAGYQLGRWQRRRTDTLDESRTAQAGTVLGAMLALAGFLLAFTFSMAGSQFDARRQLVIDDVNAIGTAFLRAEHLPEPHRFNSRRLLGEYVARRDVIFEGSRHQLMARAEELQQQLWAEATAVAQEHPTPIVSLFIQSLNEMIDLHSKRDDVELWVRIPGMVFATLAFMSVLTMTLTGYLLGLRARRYGCPTALMIVTYATVFLLVIDLDRPARGLFQVSQAPMMELRDSIHATFARQPPNAGAALPHRE